MFTSGNEDMREAANALFARRPRISRLMTGGVISIEQMYAADWFATYRSSFGPERTMILIPLSSPSQQQRDALAASYQRGVDALGPDLDLFDSWIMDGKPTGQADVERLRKALDRLRTVGFDHPSSPTPQ